MIRNTADDSLLAKLFTAADPNGSGIEAQEARGQRELVESVQLPSDGLTPELAAKHGIEIIGPSDGDAPFVNVKFPHGMAKRATEHSMWSDLVDGHGVKIASIFYKAAFYDRRAFIRFE